MAGAQRFCVAEERSGHCAAMDGHCLYVWGGYVTIEENEVYLPHDEIWVYDTEDGGCHLTDGDLPPSMSGSCGACLNGKFYIFGGYDDNGYSNQLYYVDLRSGAGELAWKQVKHFKGRPPTARDKLSCWVYKNQLIYFGGYGSRRHNELDDRFDVHDASWEGQMFFGWNNDIHVFDTTKQAWIQPVVQNTPPQARAAHSCALLGNKGYVFGGRVLQTRMNDLHFLDLDTWTWSGGCTIMETTGEISNYTYREGGDDLRCAVMETSRKPNYQIQITGEKPHGRSWHTLTPVGDDQLFLFGGLSAESVPLSDGWIYSVKTNVWTELRHLPQDQPRLWHTASRGKDNEVMVFGGSKDDLLSIDTGHCNDLLIFQTQPYPLLRLCLDRIGKNSFLFQSHLSYLPVKLLQQVKQRITFWRAARFRQSRRESCDEINKT